MKGKHSSSQLAALRKELADMTARLAKAETKADVAEDLMRRYARLVHPLLLAVAAELTERGVTILTHVDIQSLLDGSDLVVIDRLEDALERVMRYQREVALPTFGVRHPDLKSLRVSLP